MKIIYTGIQAENYNLSRRLSFEYNNFYLTLRDLPGVQVIEYPYDSIVNIGKEAFNKKLLQLVENEKPDLVFAFMFTDELDPLILNEIKKITTSIAWFADDHWRLWNYSRFYAPYFTWAITTWSKAPEIYKRYGIFNVIRSQWACNQNVWKPVEVKRDIDVSFIGQYNPSRVKIVNYLKGRGFNVYTRGWGWPEGRLSQEEMIDNFSRSKINLNFNTPPSRFYWKQLARIFFRRSVNKIIPDPLKIFNNIVSWHYLALPQIKARPFEILGCKTFLISAYADDMDRYYKSNECIVYYDGTNTDLVRKIIYYLGRDDERERIAESAYKTTIAEHTYANRFSEIFKKIG